MQEPRRVRDAEQKKPSKKGLAFRGQELNQVRSKEGGTQDVDALSKMWKVRWASLSAPQTCTMLANLQRHSLPRNSLIVTLQQLAIHKHVCFSIFLSTFHNVLKSPSLAMDMRGDAQHRARAGR